MLCLRDTLSAVCLLFAVPAISAGIVVIIIVWARNGGLQEVIASVAALMVIGHIERATAFPLMKMSPGQRESCLTECFNHRHDYAKILNTFNCVCVFRFRSRPAPKTVPRCNCDCEEMVRKHLKIEMCILLLGESFPIVTHRWHVNEANVATLPTVCPFLLNANVCVCAAS